MKIAITSQGKDIKSPVDPRFGRAMGFIIYDDETGGFDYVNNNQNLNVVQGAGIQTSKNIIDAGVRELITGNVGPKAFSALNQAGIKIMTGASGKVEDAIKDYKNGNLHEAKDANVEAHW